MINDIIWLAVYQDVSFSLSLLHEDQKQKRDRKVVKGGILQSENNLPRMIQASN